jgi:hypothetical protein
VRSAAARLYRSIWIDGGGVFVDVDYFAVLVDHERDAVGYPCRLVQHTELSRHFAFGEVAEEGNGDVVLGGKFLLGWTIIGADSKYLDIGLAEFRNTSLVCKKFLRSTTGERGGIEREYDRVLAAKVGERDLTALRGIESEIGCGVANPQIRELGLDELREHARAGQKAQQRDRQLLHIA